MQAIAFYLLYPLIFLVSRLPFRALYLLSDLLYYLLKVSGYRKKIILQNLRRSFPEKNDKEIKFIFNRYNRYLCDLILETLKTLNMSEKSSRYRCRFHNTPWLQKFVEEKQSFIIVMGHYGNWEWAGPAFTLNTNHQLVVVYRPLTNIYFEKMMVKMRTRFGTQITAVNATLRDMVANRKKVTATAFIADQTATKKNAYWTTFLHQDTAVFTGPEKLAIKFNYPVVYMSVKRPRRGFYDVYPELLVPDPVVTKENEISDIFMHRLEQDIISEPAYWLWSHKRWKHKKPVSISETD